MAPADIYGDVWAMHVGAIHDGGLEMPLCHLVLSKDHFDVTYVCVGGIHVVPDDVYWDVWVIHLSAIHGGVLDMASCQLRLSQGPIWYIGTLSGIVQINFIVLLLLFRCYLISVEESRF